MNSRMVDVAGNGSRRMQTKSKLRSRHDELLDYVDVLTRSRGGSYDEQYDDSEKLAHLMMSRERAFTGVIDLKTDGNFWLLIVGDSFEKIDEIVSSSRANFGFDCGEGHLFTAPDGRFVFNRYFKKVKDFYPNEEAQLETLGEFQRELEGELAEICNDQHGGVKIFLGWNKWNESFRMNVHDLDDAVELIWSINCFMNKLRKEAGDSNLSEVEKPLLELVGTTDLTWLGVLKDKTRLSIMVTLGSSEFAMTSKELFDTIKASGVGDPGKYNNFHTNHVKLLERCRLIEPMDREEFEEIMAKLDSQEHDDRSKKGVLLRPVKENWEAVRGLLLQLLQITDLVAPLGGSAVQEEPEMRKTVSPK